MQRFSINYFLVILAVFYGFIRIAHFVPVSTTLTNDTDTYTTIASQSIFRPEFWSGIRPFVYPLLIKLFQFNWDYLTTAQFVISVFAWSIFAYVFAKTLKAPILQILAFSFFLVFSLSTDIILWDRIVQTESINISVLILIFAAYIAKIKLDSQIPTAFLLGALFLFGFLRDTNAWLLLFIAILVTGYWAIHKVESKEYLKPAFLIAIFIMSNYTATVGNRWVVPFLNVMSMRILPQKDFIREFELRGMPVTPELMAQKEVTFSEEYITDPQLEAFRTWMFNNGKASYMKFLLRRPAYLIQSPIENWSLLFGFLTTTQGTHNDNLDYAPERFKEIIPYPLSELFYPKEYGLFATLLTLMVAGFLIAQQQDGLNQLMLLLFTTGYLMLLLNYHGDASGISRHAVSSILQMWIALWLFAFTFLDKLVSTHKAANNESTEKTFF